MNIKVLESNKNPERRPVTFADLEVGDMFLIECCNLYIKVEAHTAEDNFPFNSINLIDGSRANFSDKQVVGFYTGILITPIEGMLFYIDVNKKLSDYRKY